MELNKYTKEVLERFLLENKNLPEYQEAATNILTSLDKYIAEHPEMMDHK